jgi:hypothetical protein
MRASLLIAGALALAVAACGNNDQTDNNQNVDENLTAENIVSNDVTAIDAVTGDAANMAAEAPIPNLEANASGNVGNAAKPTAKRPSAATPPATTTNASNAAGNTAE